MFKHHHPWIIILLLSVVTFFILMLNMKAPHHMKILIDGLIAGIPIAFAFEWNRIYVKQFDHHPPLIQQVLVYVLGTMALTYLFYFILNKRGIYVLDTTDV